MLFRRRLYLSSCTDGLSGTDDFGRLGRAYVETDEKKADLEAVRGCAYDRTVQRTGVVTAFNVVEGWVKDASKEVAREVLGRAMIEQLDFPSSTADFIETHTGEGVAGFVQS